MNGCTNGSIINVVTSSWFSFVLAGLWMAFLYIMSSIPQVASYNTFYGQDKIEHIIAFGVLGFLLSRGFQPHFPGKRFRVVLLVTLIIAIYGALDEFHQMFVPGRTASVMDLIADMIGGFLAAYFVYLFHIRRMHSNGLKFSGN